MEKRIIINIQGKVSEEDAARYVADIISGGRISVANTV